MSKRNIKLVLEFDGTDFHGWQTQKDVRTVQDEVTEAILQGLNEETLLTGCSRTDAGVHAAEYCANFFTQAGYPVETLRNIISSFLPEDISIAGISEADTDFHARYSVVSKTYRYTISATAQYHPLKRKYAWHLPCSPAVELMQDASRFLEGEHDFTAFCGSLEPGKSPVRTIDRVFIEKSAGEIIIEVTGRSFLYRMVRIITGTLVDAGTGRISIHDVKKILESKDKNDMRTAAPAHGLCLMKVEYA